MHGIQAWVALPEADEEADPAFSHYGTGELPTFEEGGVNGRLVAGEAFGRRAGVKTHSPMFYLHWELAPGASTALPDDHTDRAAYVVSGTVTANGMDFEAGRMLVFAPGQPAVLTAHPDSPAGAMVMAIGGEPLGKRYIDWNFVSSRKERIEQAKADWRAGRMKLPDLDGDEFIPLPTAP